jgi:hypothetical protein
VTFDLSAVGGTWYPDAAIVSTGTNIFTLYAAGSDPATDQAAVQTIHFTTTLVTLRDARWAVKDSTATYYAVSINGVAVQRATCASNLCSVNMKLAPLTRPAACLWGTLERWRWEFTSPPDSDRPPPRSQLALAH